MNTTVTTLAAAIATATLWLAAPTLAHAGEQQGVQCPAGTEAIVSNGEKRLQCAKTETIEREAVCSPLVFRGNGDINLNTRIEHLVAGRDRCQVVGGNGKTASAAPQFVPLPGDPAAAEFTQIERAGKDVFRATRRVYVFPQGAIFNPLDSAALGVQCPSGYDGDALPNGRGIRCDRQAEERRADCDLPWSLLTDRRGHEDRCMLANQEGETKPVGMTHVQMQVEKALDTISWTVTKRDGGDRWVKKTYAFPTSSR
ncbi:MAG: hypothetical protein RL223_4534 [Pseudomonadota bacterium]|jgi:hypothetical protein